MKNLNKIKKYIDSKTTQDCILIILIRLHLELFLFIFLLILSKPLTISLVLLKLIILFCKPLSFFIINIYVIKYFNYLYVMPKSRDSLELEVSFLYHEYWYIWYGVAIMSGFVAGVATYVSFDKGIDFIKDTMRVIESEEGQPAAEALNRITELRENSEVSSNINVTTVVVSFGVSACVSAAVLKFFEDNLG